MNHNYNFFLSYLKFWGKNANSTDLGYLYLHTWVIPTLTSLDTDEDPLIISPVPLRKLELPLKNPVRSTLRASSREGSLIGPPLLVPRIRNHTYKIVAF